MKFSEDTLAVWTKPPSETEEEKLVHSINMVKKAVSESYYSDELKIFGQGSYANNTNVKLNSDIDINIHYPGIFNYFIPKEYNKSDFGISDSDYTYGEYRNDIYEALARKFEPSSIKRKNKCFKILGNSYRIMTDVIPTIGYRKYHSSDHYDEGTCLISEDNRLIINFPLQHIENAKLKNENTLRRYKKLTRILKKIRYKLEEDSNSTNESITSFLLECLLWNIPNHIFVNQLTWTDRLEETIKYLYTKTVGENPECINWNEVSDLLPLFGEDRKWTIAAINSYMIILWDYLGFRDE